MIVNILAINVNEKKTRNTFTTELHCITKTVHLKHCYRMALHFFYWFPLTADMWIQSWVQWELHANSTQSPAAPRYLTIVSAWFINVQCSTSLSWWIISHNYPGERIFRGPVARTNNLIQWFTWKWKLSTATLHPHRWNCHLDQCSPWAITVPHEILLIDSYTMLQRLSPRGSALGVDWWSVVRGPPYGTWIAMAWLINFPSISLPHLFAYTILLWWFITLIWYKYHLEYNNIYIVKYKCHIFDRLCTLLSSFLTIWYISPERKLYRYDEVVSLMEPRYNASYTAWFVECFLLQ